MNQDTNNGNITFFVSDSKLLDDTNDGQIDLLMNQLQNINCGNPCFIENRLFSELYSFYHEKYTIAQLLKICDYYNLTKYVKIAKYKKKEIIDSIVLFEMDFVNNDAVSRRQQLWYYMEELMNDKYMKKYIIWS
uniref:Uncharacterized protein n=1 Tax=viral metagenome TaxID=1070528 RepID=A0A6C0E1L0_9ZZZZ